jgi:hypothetical protein
LLSAVEDDQDRQDARAVLQVLFPAFAEKNAVRANAGRFAHPDYFDRYLAQSIPEGDIPDAVVARALVQAAVGLPEELHALVLSDDDEQVTLALSKVRVRYPDIGEPWMRWNAPEGPLSIQLLRIGMGLVDQLPDRATSWTSSQSQTTYWMANVLRLLLDAHPDADVDPALAACTQTHRRAHVVSAANGTMEHVRPETQEALQNALRREAARVLAVLLADLREGDASAREAGTPFLYALVDDAGLLPDLQVMIREGLAAGDFTVEDVAARFVGFAYLVGGSTGAPPSSVSFAGALFTKVTGIEADSEEHSERETWDDISWARRRAFAARYIKGPASETS